MAAARLVARPLFGRFEDARDDDDGGGGGAEDERANFAKLRYFVLTALASTVGLAAARSRQQQFFWM